MALPRGGLRLPTLLTAGVAAVALIVASHAAAATGPGPALRAALPADGAGLHPQGASPAGIRAADTVVHSRAVTASAGITDAIGDGSPAPDLATMVALTSDDGRYTVGIGLDSNALIEGDYVMTFVNTDGNAATGEPTFGGADLAVTIIGRFGTDQVAAQAWNGVGWQAASLPSLVSLASGLTDEIWSVSAAEAGILPGVTTTLVFGTMYAGTYDDDFDFAPEPGAGTMPFTTGALAPPPAPAAPVVSATTPPAPSGLPAPAAPLAVRSFALSPTAAGLRMRLGWSDGTGTVRWTLRVSGRIAGRPVRRVMRGRAPAGARTVLRTIPLPTRWTGMRVTTRLEVRDASRTLVRTRAVRI